MASHEIVEHHFDFRKSGPERSWTATVESVTNRREAIARLAELRTSGNIPETLDHWTVGGDPVYGQSATTLWERQGMDTWCTTCAVPMQYDPGYSPSARDPGQEPAYYCPECGCEEPATHPPEGEES